MFSETPTMRRDRPEDGDLFFNRVLFWKKLVDEAFVHDGGGLGVGPVSLTQRSATQDGDAQSLEVPRVHRLPVASGLFIVTWLGPAVDGEIRRDDTAAPRQVDHRSETPNAGHLFESPHHLALEPQYVIILRVAILRNRELRREPSGTPVLTSRRTLEVQTSS